ncbi:MAG TPA: STAS domain-containing protein [Magnetospirillum sp.]|nr:STAS domain-containing protein [Magnetospirillum sp.]
MEESHTITVAFHGPMTLRGIDSARSRMFAAVALNDRVEIDCSKVEEADVGFVQMLLAARLGASQLGKTVRLTGPATGALRATLERAGFISPDVGKLDPFWAGE